MMYPNMVRIKTTSEKFGAVDFDLVGTIATQTSMHGEYFSPTRTFDESMKWIIDQINSMRQESPDLYFVP